MIGAIDIQRWVPDRFDEVVGNRDLIEYFGNGIEVNGAIPNTLITGESRSGKTSIVKLFVKTLFCLERRPGARGPCGTCENCRDNIGRFRQTGLWVLLRAHGPAGDTEFIPINCMATEAEIRATLGELRDRVGCLCIIYLDEIHRLERRGVDELFLKPLEEHNFSWIASSATVHGLERMFLNRFPARLCTALPTFDELAEWLIRRCQAWEIGWDEVGTFVELANHAGLNPGKALHVLARAAAAPARTLTAQLVQRHRFDAESFD